ncbi:TetR/AcrR family transcriptional regulator [Oceanobacillus piezotolerans]|uniref:TetR/AcrR family transcriptional regulator n=1 Tax=Oceanobacillus piezotolerans TaxID=2448030 RepID=A0A498DEQ1_9BACI|nr:TetR/AcrR family transcriptional regulator [Oceanobacillus piezotolerans]RLL47130.1 TetR/AcrR family transcriptional regulator [Oceanobacillus piezotolerans]
MMKKQLIMEQALELFAEQGIDATSVQQITDKCGISKGAFYLSFKSKDELILTVLDDFIKRFISDIDYVVNNREKENLLYEFYLSILNFFNEHSNFAKIFVKQQNFYISKEFIIKLEEYQQLFDRTVFKLVDRYYGDKVEDNKYDLAYCIQGFMKLYADLFFSMDIPVDMNRLCQSLVEKTDLIAAHTTIPVITKKISQLMNKPSCENYSKDEICTLIQQELQEMEESIEKDSLILLKEDLSNPKLSPALLNGLLENIRHHPQCKWISYLLRSYYAFEK